MMRQTLSWFRPPPVSKSLTTDSGEEDKAKIASWFATAAESGEWIAAFNMGVDLAKGVGVERDDKTAAIWLRRAAEGVPEAQYAYGRLLAEGTGVLDSRAKCNRALREPDLHVFAKLFEDCLKRSLEAQAFSGREIGGDDDVLDFLVGHFVDVDLTRQPAS